MKYYIEKKSQLTFDETLTKVESELKQEGFGVLTEIDVQATLKKKLDVDFKRYKILGACNPPFAYEALKSEDKIGVLLPCNVIVEESENGEVEVAMVNPLVAMSSVENESLAKIAEQISDKLAKVLDKV